MAQTDSLIDRAEREAAIDPASSFIVQAPAGSGKTALLTQRVLRLLAMAQVPEEVLAITFTRKAAAEMRERISTALVRAGNPVMPDDSHEARIWQLARAVRERDQARGWNLQRHPARLRILTLDAFNAALIRQTPLLSGFGAAPEISDQAQELYLAAARRTIEGLDSSSRWSQAIGAFLLHLDNQIDRAEELLADMLAHRDQWLPRLMSGRSADREALEAAMGNEIRLVLAEVCALVPGTIRPELARLAAAAADRLSQTASGHAIAACRGLEDLPGTDPASLPVWKGLAALLLTAGGDWRKKIDVSIGFPPGAGEEKRQLQDLLASLAHLPALAAALQRIRGLPDPRYTDAQWQLLQALCELLPLAAAELQLEFAERGMVDHCEVALRALQALGEEERPTDLALALDYRISHILVDEFQDVSTSQFRLLESLTRGWSPGDGRSLFLVGDPMQSIYRFREAEVGLFLRARHAGIGQLRLRFLRLKVNFRSKQPLVQWVNRTFPALLPEQEDAAAGAVPFESAMACDQGDQGDQGGVGVHAQLAERADDRAEADAVARMAAMRLQDTPAGKVAILVRTRKRAAAILPALRRAGLACEAVEIESLATRPVVQDLLALTRALSHEGDRSAWLAVLRAPWCGLTLTDLCALAGDDRQRTIPELLGRPERLNALDAEARARIDRLLPVLEEARMQRGRGSLRRRVESTWEALGGPAVAGSPAALEDAAAYLELLEGAESAGDLDDPGVMDQALASLYARPDPAADPRLQLMTIHKSKGLEFDTVILPGLHAGAGRSRQRLLLWTERPRLGAGPDLLLAPIRPAGDPDRDPLYGFVHRLVQEKEAHELGRLIYVATTRAIRRLELFGWVGVGQDEQGGDRLKPPGRSAILGRLWPAVETACSRALAERQAPVPGSAEVSAPQAALRRVAAGWRVPPPAPAVPWAGGVVAGSDPGPPIEYSWAGHTARLVGTATHRWLQRMARESLHDWTSERVMQQRPAIRAMLRSLGMAPAALAAAEARTLSGLQGVLEDPVARWILGPHPEAESELPLCTWTPTGPVTRVIDRCFVDRNGDRWVIDYKTGWREGGDIEGFLEQEVGRYAAQLRTYAALLRLIDPRPVRLGLYFSLLGRFREVSPEPDGPSGLRRTPPD